MTLTLKRVEVQAHESSSMQESNNALNGEKDSKSQKALRRLAWNPAWAGSKGAFEWAEFESGLLEVEEGTSHHLHERATFFLTEMQLERSNMICIDTDGASMMVCRLNGVTIRFKQENSFMTFIHCIAHRASLCLVDAVKGIAYAQLIDQVVNEIASTFSKSSNKSAKLAELEREFGCVVLHMSHIDKVWWLSRALCIHKVCEFQLEPLLIFLKEHNSTLFDKVRDFQFMYNLHFMADILQRLATLSKIFQSTIVDVTIVIGLIKAEMRLITMQFVDVPVVDVNASILDRLEYPIIPDYGPHSGQLARFVHQFEATCTCL
ncbi:hypothetical protein L7F22_000179 [Adiantum nelumboides]|nr:hypothetical protein [Adiantum nelumboides]